MDGSVTFKKENLPETQLTFIDLSFNQFSFLITQPSNFSDQLQGAQRYLKSYFLSFPKSKNINLISQIIFLELAKPKQSMLTVNGVFHPHSA